MEKMLIISFLHLLSILLKPFFLLIILTFSFFRTGSIIYTVPLHILRDWFQQDTAYNIHLAESLQNSFFFSFILYCVEPRRTRSVKVRYRLQRKNSQGPTRKFPTLQGQLIKCILCISLLKAISPFPTVFSKDLYCRHIKTRACLGKGKEIKISVIS